MTLILSHHERNVKVCNMGSLAAKLLTEDAAEVHLTIGCIWRPVGILAQDFITMQHIYSEYRNKGILCKVSATERQRWYAVYLTEPSAGTKNIATGRYC